MVYNFLLYIHFFMRCFKLEVKIENLPCDKISFCRCKFLPIIFFTDECFFPSNIFWRQIGMNFLIQNFEFVLFCNDFSCRSNVLGSLTTKLRHELIVRGIQVAQRNNEYKGCTSNAAL